MNLQSSSSTSVGVSKPRSRGDEPIIGNELYMVVHKTPLTRG